MIDHVSVGVSDLERAARFYELALAPLQPDSGTHICLRAKTADDVDAFHTAALHAGGRSDGAPGLRPHDRVRYYAAFVIDPDGNRIEAVTFPKDDAEASPR